jgi:deoxyuridine 5'-triphosphate nucleotidohydrolase
MPRVRISAPPCTSNSRCFRVRARWYRRALHSRCRPDSKRKFARAAVLLNAPGTIDADYRGPVNVILANFGTEPFLIRRGDRIAQIIVAPVSHAAFAIVENLDETTRHTGGFGSTGTSTPLGTEVGS